MSKITGLKITFYDRCDRRIYTRAIEETCDHHYIPKKTDYMYICYGPLDKNCISCMTPADEYYTDSCSSIASSDSDSSSSDDDTNSERKK